MSTNPPQDPQGLLANLDNSLNTTMRLTSLQNRQVRDAIREAKAINKRLGKHFVQTRNTEETERKEEEEEDEQDLASNADVNQANDIGFATTPNADGTFLLGPATRKAILHLVKITLVAMRDRLSSIEDRPASGEEMSALILLWASLSVLIRLCDWKEDDEVARLMPAVQAWMEGGRQV